MQLLSPAALGLWQHHRSCCEYVAEEAGSGDGQEAERVWKGQESLHPFQMYAPIYPTFFHCPPPPTSIHPQKGTSEDASEP